VANEQAASKSDRRRARRRCRDRDLRRGNERAISDRHRSDSATATAAVIRTTLASRQQVAGTLERAGSYTLVSQQLTGTLSWLPPPGTVISRGGVLYRVDGQPVRLLYGSQSAWRTLAIGVTDGADVRELEPFARPRSVRCPAAQRHREHQCST
jgi:hypothetical protein